MGQKLVAFTLDELALRWNISRQAVEKRIKRDGLHKFKKVNSEGREVYHVNIEEPLSDKEEQAQHEAEQQQVAQVAQHHNELMGLLQIHHDQQDQLAQIHRAHREEVGRLADQLQASHRDRMEEVKHLQDQLQAKDQAHLESTGRIQDQLAQVHQAHREEVERLHARGQAQRWRLPAVAVALLFVGSVGLVSGWYHRGQMAEQTMETHKGELARLADWHREEVANLRQDLREVQDHAENLRDELEASQSTLEGLKATLGANLEP